MANELTLTITGTFTKNAQTVVPPGITSLGITVTGNPVAEGVLNVANTDTVIPLGPITGTLGWCFLKNLDTANAISIRVAAAGTKIIRLLAGEEAAFRIDAGITAPVAIADVNGTLMAFCILTT